MMRAAAGAACADAAVRLRRCEAAKAGADAAAESPSSADCTLKHPSKDVLSLKALPPSVRDALTKLTGGMADRGEFFNAGDAVTTPGPFNRFIRAGQTQGGWYVW